MNMQSFGAYIKKAVALLLQLVYGALAACTLTSSLLLRHVCTAIQQLRKIASD